MSTHFETVFLQSLGWALVHAVWQITALALLVALVLPRQKSAHVRYWLAFSGLFSSFGVFLATFTWVFSSKFSADSTVEAGVQNVFLPSVNLPVAASGYLETLNTWLEEHTSVVVLCWLLGFALSLFRLLGGVYYLHRLQRNSCSPTADYWQEKMVAMGRQLGLERPVRLLESVLVRSPMALGYFKPIIFFPLGLWNHLSPAEVEAILAHELAHIARRDWLFNLFQAFIETLFYFHPAIWWMSSVVRAERENCCDDTAVQLTGNRVMLAKALLHLQQLYTKNSVPVLALGAKGRTHFFRRFSLLTRIQRILNQPSPQKLLIMEKFVTTVFLLGILALVGVRANGFPQLEAFKTALSETSFGWLADLPEVTIAADSVPKPARRVQKITREEDGKRVEMEVKDGEVTRLNIDGKEIPANEITQHRALTNDLIRNMVPPPPPTIEGIVSDLKDLIRNMVPPPPPPPFPPVPPPPPFPPVPPVPGVPPVPPVPPMPPIDGEGMGFHFESPGAVSRLSTTKDGEGNTVIRLEREGKPVEIKVKNGEVWVDGQKVENDGSLELSQPRDIHIGQGENYVFYRGDLGKDGNFYFNGDNEFPEAEAARLEASQEMETSRAQLMEAYEEMMKLSEKDRVKQEKTMQKVEKELRKAQKEMEKQQRILEDQQRKLDADRRDRPRSAQ